MGGNASENLHTLGERVGVCERKGEVKGGNERD